MKMRTRRQLIDEINDAFIVFAEQVKGAHYIKLMKEINKEIIDNVENITPLEVGKIVESKAWRVDDTAVLFMLLSALTIIIENPRLEDKRGDLLPILAIVAVVGLANPKRLVKTLYQASINPKTPQQKKIAPFINEYTLKNSSTLERIKADQVNYMRQAMTKAKIKQSQIMLDDVRSMTQEGKPIEMQRHWLTRKHNADKVIMRALDTELHAQAELSKVLHAQDVGFTQKIWRTQGDDRVRKTRFHNQIANQQIGIVDDFTIGQIQASQPGDMRLPPSERINCRCYLIFK